LSSASSRTSPSSPRPNGSILRRLVVPTKTPRRSVDPTYKTREGTLMGSTLEAW
jgi:hypothetical protein